MKSSLSLTIRNGGLQDTHILSTSAVAGAGLVNSSDPVDSEGWPPAVALACCTTCTKDLASAYRCRFSD